MWGPALIFGLLRPDRFLSDPDSNTPDASLFDASLARLSPYARFFLGDLRWVARFEPNRCEPNRSTYRQRLPKVCLQQFHGQDEN